MRNALHGLFKQTAEAVLPPLSKSAFEEKRVLTPAEFVRAGDYLVRACPTWSWEGGDPAKARSYLPPNKQYLVTRGVPCLSRAATVERYDPRCEFSLGGDDEGWTATHQDPSAGADAGAAAGPSGGAAAAGGDDGIPDLDDDGAAAPAAPTSAAPAAAAGTGGDDDVPDISELELVEPEDEAALPPTAAATAGPSAAAAAAGGVGGSSSGNAGGSDAIRATRTYDLYVTYDQYYQVPRMWLVGFDEAKAPLPPTAVLEDVSEEHARKTITLDAHPHLGGVSAASIHPCRHADVMKKLADNLEAGGGGAFLVDHYLVLFLKFIASVVPTISYDHTMSVGGGGQ